MRCVVISTFVLALAVVVAGQSIDLKGTLFDPNGSVVVGAEVMAVPANGKATVKKSGNEGEYSLRLEPGKYRLEFHAPGFRRNIVNEYLLVNSTKGTMHFDVVLLVSGDHEPCGYGGHCVEISNEKETISPEKITTRSKTEVNDKTKQKPRK
jgi:hypothetical protein